VPIEIKPREQCPDCAAKGLDTAKDNLAIYADGKYCQSCGYIEKVAPIKEYSALIAGTVQELKDRGLTLKTCEKYNIRTTLYTGRLNGIDVDKEPIRIFPYYDKGKVVKQKIKSALDKKKQSQKGNTEDKSLFGQNLFSPSEKIPVVITEGEEDAAAMWQMTQLPSVSIGNGAGNAKKELAINLEWLSGFKEVLLAFDNDAPGLEAFNSSVLLFEPGKVKKVNFPLKDANEMLKAGREDEVKKCLWNAEIVKPSTIVFPSEVANKVLQKPNYGIPFPWPSMTKATYGMRTGEVYLLAGPTSSGKEQPLSAKISTPNGWKLMGDIQVGDIIHGCKTLTKVIGVYPQGNKPVYKVTFEDGRNCETGLEHIWAVSTHKQIKKNRVSNKEYFYKKTTKELLKDIEIKDLFVKVCSPVEYPIKSYVIPPYSFGVLLGDGCLTGAGIQISSNEIDIIDKVGVELSLQYRKNQHNYTYTFYTLSSNKKYRKYIVDNKLNVKSGEKYIPEEYLRGNIAQRLDLLKGLMDTDGSIGKSGNYTFSTTSTKLMKGFVELCRGLGYIVSIGKDNRNKYKSGVCYRIAIKTNDLIVSSNKQTEKYFKYKNKGNRVYKYDYIKIKSIKYVREEESQCIMVDAEDHLYLTNDYIVTHNTELVMSIIRWLVNNGCKIGNFSFEQRPEQSLQRYIGSEVNERLHIPGCEGWNEVRIQEELTKLGDSIALYQPESGHISIESVLINIRYLAKAYGMTFFVVDNLKAMATHPYIDGKRVAAHDYASHCMANLVMIAKQLNITIFVVNHLAADKISRQAYVSTSPKNSDEYLSRSSEDMQEYINRPGMDWETGRIASIDNIFGGGAIKDLTDYIIVVARNRMSKDEEEHRTLIVKFLKTRLDSSYEGFTFKLKYNYQTGRLEEINKNNDEINNNVLK